MRRSLAVAGAAFGAALAVAGCHQETGPPDADLSHHRTMRAFRVHHERGPAHRGDGDAWTGRAIRERVAREVTPVPLRPRPPTQPENGCASSHRSDRGAAVHCVQRSGQDVDRSGDTVVRDNGPDDGSDD
ncbi:hypothetical protein [Actinoallomurus sp. CA-150999]|uniref:hypothetical protein n=1 Tax=Actinoallomurus sp. CA-150999 TaxID=3239887 RepID=UPI003D91C49B